MGNPSDRVENSYSGPAAAEERDHTRGLPDHGAEQRDVAAEQRDVAAERRDQAAEVRDQAAEVRDQAAEVRDQAADLRDQASEKADWAAEPDVLIESRPSAMARQDAFADRKHASNDRLAGADERTQAEHDRETALVDREMSAKDRGDASHDDLTGAYLRGAGIAELKREMARALRSRQPLVVAFVDVNQLKSINDRHGHAVGDQVLIEVTQALAAQLRPYDLIIRYGGDEFVCAMPGVNRGDAAQRLGRVNGVLAAGYGHGSVTCGLTELRPGDTPEDVIARADAAFYRERQRRGRIRD